MADQAKKKRSIALSAFTRNLNTLLSLMNQSSHIVLVSPQFEKFQQSWDKLEAAHEEFMEKTDIDIEVDSNGLQYLDEPNERKEKGIMCYASYLKISEDDKNKEIFREDEKVEEKRMKMVQEQTLAASVKK